MIQRHLSAIWTLITCLIAGHRWRDLSPSGDIVYCRRCWTTRWGPLNDKHAEILAMEQGEDIDGVRR